MPRRIDEGDAHASSSLVVTAPAIADAVARELHRESGAAAWDVSLATFTQRLTASAASRFKSGATASELESYLRALHLNDLALACACASGHDAAWEHFVREMRPALYAAARAIARQDDARDLADSLYAQLFGVDAKGQQRRSLLDYYHGRARLSTWLRTVLAQRHIDAVRERARTVPLDDDAEEPASGVPAADPDVRDNVARVQQALNETVDALDPRDRLRLRLYYAQKLTLAKIGRALGEHEATASRNLDRVRRTLRQEVERRLKEAHGMDAAAVAVCLQQALEAPDLDLSPALEVGSDPASPKRSFVLRSGVGVARQEDEALERLLTRTLRSQTATGEVCPSAEDVAAYLERSLDAEEMRRVELHLSSCARCTETLALLVESQPAATSVPPPAAWWSWSAWRWAVPAAAVLVIGVWFATTFQNGREPASKMAQYNQAEAPKKEANELAAHASAESPAQSAAPSGTPSAKPAATEARSRRTDLGAAGAQTAPDPSARANQTPADERREAEKASERDQSLNQAARAASAADATSPEQPRSLAKAEESRADAALSDAAKEGANAGFAPPAASGAAPAAAPAAAREAPPAAPPPTAPAGGGAARAAAGAAAPAAARRQQAAEAAPQGASAVAGFAPLVLRTRSGNALWRIAGSVVERSTDGGTTWTTEFRASASINTGVVAADDTLWLVGARGLVLRRPPAVGWQVVPPPSMDDLTGVSDPGPTAVTVRAADGRQFRTTDSGATWMAR